MIKLSKISSKVPKELKKEKIEAKTLKLTEKIGEIIEIIWAEKKHSLLVVFQGMDASGKDGAFKNVFQSVPQAAVTYKSYGKPTTEEFAHDFLWRIHKNAPAKGTVSASIRSHYEDILIQRVHDWIDDKRVAVRMNAINAYEQLLEADNNTVVLKFYMHISPERQLEKLAERIEVTAKNWKHKDGDWEEHKLWDKYMKAYEYAINKSAIAWTIVPSDERWYRDYIVAEKVYKTLLKIKANYVKLAVDSPAHGILKQYKASMPNTIDEDKKIEKKSAKKSDKTNAENPSKSIGQETLARSVKQSDKSIKEPKSVKTAKKAAVKKGRKTAIRSKTTVNSPNTNSTRKLTTSKKSSIKSVTKQVGRPRTTINKPTVKRTRK